MTEVPGHLSSVNRDPSLPELLAPAGDWECARAAVENGADAIYFGLSRFNARLRAQNFTEEDLPELMEWLHRRGVRGYVTFNTLVFTPELEAAVGYLRAIISSRVDAAIVQDVGMCRLIRRLSPDFPIHASTQMTITSAAGVEIARDLGCELVVLARENSIPEIDRIHGAIQERRLPVRLEVFVHGALCVAYSGQCLTSEALGGRSANRGECAQACRLPYDLVSDGTQVDLGDRRYLLSPQDLAGIDRLAELARAGVASLKIEGRLKTPEYVASITRLYRAALDRLRPSAAASALGTPAAGSAESRSASPNSRCAGGSDSTRYEMEMAFSRGLFTGWLDGTDNRRLVHARFGKKRGVFVGTVGRVDQQRVWLKPESPLKAGDGVVFDAGRPQDQEEGGRIFDLVPSRSRPGEVGLSFRRGAIHFDRIHAGNRVWKTSDPDLERHLRQSFEADAPRFTRPIWAEVHGVSGDRMRLVLRDEDGTSSEVFSSMPLQSAIRQPLDEARLRENIGRLGGTCFHLQELQSFLRGPVLLPVSELNKVRREAVAQLQERRGHPRAWTFSEEFSELTDAEVVEALRIRGFTPFSEGSRHLISESATAPDVSISPYSLIVLVRTMDQLEAALKAKVRTIYCEFEDPRRYRDAVQRVRSADGQKTEVFVAPPRIFKPGEDWILKQVRSADPDGYLLRNYDHLTAFPGVRSIGDFSLNIANPLAAEFFVSRFKLERATASYDLNADQLSALLAAAPPEWFEITIHQHMPMFHMEHCVFCAFLSSGKDYRDCGRPCDRHRVHLRDRVGADHPIKADAGCRNTVFNARAQTGADHLHRFRSAGARHFRIEFLEEPAEEAERLIERYRSVLDGRLSPESLWKEFRLVKQLGVTRGQLGRSTGADVGGDRWAGSSHTH